MVIGKEIKMIYLKDDKLTISFPELHPNAGVSIDLQRILSLPDDREPNTSIQPSFNINVISKYFSNYKDEVRRWCDES